MRANDVKNTLKVLANLSNAGAKKPLANDDKFDQELKEANANRQAKMAFEEMEVENFRQNLTKMGALNFINYLKLEKIEEKIKAKKEELIKQLGLDEEGIKGKNAKEIAELKDVLETLLEQFKKELLAQASNNTLLEKQQKLTGSKLGGILNLI